MSYWGGSAAAADPKNSWISFCHSSPATYIPRRFFYAFFPSLCVALALLFCVMLLFLCCCLSNSWLWVRCTYFWYNFSSRRVSHSTQQQQKSFLFDLSRSFGAAYRPSSFLPQSPRQPRVGALTNEQEQTHSTHTLLLRISSSTADHRASKQRRGGWEDIKT